MNNQGNIRSIKGGYQVQTVSKANAAIRTDKVVLSGEQKKKLMFPNLPKANKAK